MNKVIFLDRDGTINEDKHYIYKIENFEFISGAVTALKLFQSAGYKLIIITNQSGIAKGIYEEKDFLILNNYMCSTLAKEGILINGVYYCPHHPDAKINMYKVDCDCRKPKLGLYKKAIYDFNVDLKRSYAIGDKISDCAICQNSDCRGFLIGKNEREDIIDSVKKNKIHNIKYANDLLETAHIITNM